MSSFDEDRVPHTYLQELQTNGVMGVMVLMVGAVVCDADGNAVVPFNTVLWTMRGSVHRGFCALNTAQVSAGLRAACICVYI